MLELPLAMLLLLPCFPMSVAHAPHRPLPSPRPSACLQTCWRAAGSCRRPAWCTSSSSCGLLAWWRGSSTSEGWGVGRGGSPGNADGAASRSAAARLLCNEHILPLSTVRIAAWLPPTALQLCMGCGGVGPHFQRPLLQRPHTRGGTALGRGVPGCPKEVHLCWLSAWQMSTAFLFLLADNLLTSDRTQGAPLWNRYINSRIRRVVRLAHAAVLQANCTREQL